MELKKSKEQKRRRRKGKGNDCDDVVEKTPPLTLDADDNRDKMVTANNKSLLASRNLFRSLTNLFDLVPQKLRIKTRKKTLARTSSASDELGYTPTKLYSPFKIDTPCKSKNSTDTPDRMMCMHNYSSLEDAAEWARKEMAPRSLKLLNNF